MSSGCFSVRGIQSSLMGKRMNEKEEGAEVEVEVEFEMKVGQGSKRR